jgi:hypothetical protein
VPEVPLRFKECEPPYPKLTDPAEVAEAQVSSMASTRPFFGDPSSAEFSHLTRCVRAQKGLTGAATVRTASCIGCSLASSGANVNDFALDERQQ